jgi:hypothetical protein
MVYIAKSNNLAFVFYVFLQISQILVDQLRSYSPFYLFLQLYPISQPLKPL